MSAKISFVKVAITVESSELKKIDYYVKKKVFRNRSQAFQLSIRHTLEHLEHSRLAEECEKLDPHFEQGMAETGL